MSKTTVADWITAFESTVVLVAAKLPDPDPVLNVSAAL